MPQQQSESMNIIQLQQFAINIVEGVCGIICMPVEIILRPQYGTRYSPLPVVFFSAMMMIFLPLFSSVTTSVANMIPFHQAQMPVGLLSIGSLFSLYFFLSFLHGLRLWRRMIYMELEQHSEFEGPPLPFFRLIPRSRSFWFTRIVLEPAFVLISAIVLERLFIIQPGLSTYLHFAAFALLMKNFIGWYWGWEFARILMDQSFASPIVAKLVENKATEDDLAPIHLASFPKNLSPEIRRAAVSHLARLFPSGSEKNSD
jgi:hypothetical protein